MYFEHNGMFSTKNMQHSRSPVICTGSPPPHPNPPPLAGTARPGLCIRVQCITLQTLDWNPKTWNQNRSVRTVWPSNTDSLFFWCSFVPIGRRGGGVLTPLAHFCTADGLRILTTEITTGSRDHLETLTVVRLVPIILRVTEDESGLAVFRRVRGWSLFEVKRLSTSSHPNNTFKI